MDKSFIKQVVIEQKEEIEELLRGRMIQRTIALSLTGKPRSQK